MLMKKRRAAQPAASHFSSCRLSGAARRLVVILFALLPILGFAGAQTTPSNRANLQAGIDPQLARFIASIQAVDNHAHVVLPPPGDATDRDFDALPVDTMDPQTDPVAWRPDNPQLPAAWKALWHFEAPVPLTPLNLQRLQAARARVKSQQGQAYDNWVLDQAGIATVLANRVSMGQGIGPPRSRWVPYADALLFPLDNSGSGGGLT